MVKGTGYLSQEKGYFGVMVKGIRSLSFLYKSRIDMQYLSISGRNWPHFSESIIRTVSDLIVDSK